MNLIDEIYTDKPFYGSRRIRIELGRKHLINLAEIPTTEGSEEAGMNAPILDGVPKLAVMRLKKWRKY